MTGHAATCQAPWAALGVDDDAGVRQSLRLCLEAAGARVHGVATGRAALEALDRGHFDVVYLDLWLGSEAGMDVLPEMLQRQEDLGVIVVTAFATIESAVDAVKRGAVDYIPKPVRAEALFASLQTHLGVRFVTEVSAQKASAAGWTLADARPRDGAGRLMSGVEIGDVTELDDLARELLAGDPEELLIGQRIERLVGGFDFEGLRELAESLREGARGN